MLIFIEVTVCALFGKIAKRFLAQLKPFKMKINFSIPNTWNDDHCFFESHLFQTALFINVQVIRQLQFVFLIRAKTN